jgi:hypothetical protein
VTLQQRAELAIQRLLCHTNSQLPHTPVLSCCCCCFLLPATPQSNGHELYLRDPRTTYGLPLGKPLLWKDIAEVARRQGDTAIGYTRMTHVTAGGSMQLGHGSEPHLGVVADSELTLLPGDKLVVVALD